MLSISNPHKKIDYLVNLPLSKSIINRLLVISHFAGGRVASDLPSVSSDIAVMNDMLTKIKEGWRDSAQATEIHVGNAGTVMRFLTAVLAVTPGKWTITGIERMKQRPIKPLTDALESLGVELIFEQTAGYPPVTIFGNMLLKGGCVKLDAGISSQFISAMMMLGPVLKGGLIIELQGKIISGSYIRMTQALMQKAGAEVSFSENTITIKEGRYKDIDFSSITEPDWSAAAFWYEVAALAPDASIFLKGLRPESVQGDSVLPVIFKDLGVNTSFTGEGLLLTKSGPAPVNEYKYDFTDCPDLAQAVIVTCAALGIKGRFSGLKTLRVKETDRIEALRNELTKLGCQVGVIDDQIVLNGGIPRFHQPISIVTNCYDDHRMAMSFAPLALIRDGMILDAPEVVKKSYPGFWKDMAGAGFVMSYEI